VRAPEDGIKLKCRHQNGISSLVACFPVGGVTVFIPGSGSAADVGPAILGGSATGSISPPSPNVTYRWTSRCGRCRLDFLTQGALRSLTTAYQRGCFVYSRIMLVFSTMSVTQTCPPLVLVGHVNLFIVRGSNR